MPERVWCSHGICDVGMYKYMHCHVSVCSLIRLWPQQKKGNSPAVDVCVCVRVPYLVKKWNDRLPPVKLELLVNVVLQALTHTTLLVC